MPNSLLSARQLADRLECSKSTVWRLVHSGRIPVIQLTPQVFRFEWDAVLMALATGKPNKAEAVR